MNFKELIKKHGFNFSSLAKKVGVTRAAVSYWFKNRAIPNREVLEKTSEVLDERIDTIVAAIALGDGKQK